MKKDENDRLREGTLPSDPSEGTERVAPLRVVKPDEKRAPGEPCDLPAERALLGALLWAGANQPETLRVRAVVDLLETAEPFYGRGHGAIYTAIRACADARAEHDPVAVHADLVRAGQDRAAGGLDALHALVTEASTVSERQARIYAESIRRSWARRAAVLALRVLAEDARSPKADLVQLVERAQAVVAEMAQRATTSATSVSIAESMKGLRAQLEAKKNTAMATGLRDVDRALNGGLRPREVSVVGARTNVGKSILSAQIGEHMVTADPTLAVLYITLEMGHEMFTARLLAARSGVPISNMRRAEIDPVQWSAITAAEAKLAKKGIFFADNPQQTMASVYATALERQRLLAREGKRLGMIVLDHLGLVKPSAEALKKASREGQVAETSRAQRYLAAQLGVHVLGIAQIGRAAEQKGIEGMPRLHHLRECLTGETVVVDAMTGDRVTVREIAAGRPIAVHGLGDDMKVRCAQVSMAWSTGVKTVLRLTTETGRTVRCTANHPLRTLVGWTEASTLALGERIAVPRITSAAILPTRELTDDEIRMLGYLISDGSYAKHRSVSYVKADPFLVEDVARIASERFGVTAKGKRCQGIAQQIELTMTGQGRRGNALIDWLRDLGVHGQIIDQKRIPAPVFRCDARQLGIFLGHLWAGDGSVVPRASGGWALKFTSTSMALLDEVHELLTRVGVVACRGGRERNSKSKRDISTITVSDADAILQFASVIQIPGVKGSRLEEAVAWCRASSRNAHVDRLPLVLTRHVAEAKRASGMSWSDLGYRCQGKEMCRSDLSRVAGRLGRADLAQLADSDVLWDEVVSIEPDGEEETFDLRVPGLGNFVAGNVFVHNSGAIEQDADIIMILHRERDPQTGRFRNDKPPALAVAKGRMEDTAVMLLDFDGARARFADWNGSEHYPPDADYGDVYT